MEGLSREDVILGMLPWPLMQTVGMVICVLVFTTGAVSGFASSTHAATCILAVLGLAAGFLGPFYGAMVDRMAAAPSLEAWDAEHRGDLFAWLAAILPPMLQNSFIVTSVFTVLATNIGYVTAYLFTAGEHRGTWILRLNNLGVVSVLLLFGGFIILAIYPTLPLALKLVARAALIFAKEALVVIIFRYWPRRSPSGQRTSIPVFASLSVPTLCVFAFLLRLQQVLCRANMAHIRQSKPASGLGCPVKFL
jgi:hypothetical protein